LVWPYRPDVLIRIDFLDWWHAARTELWPDARGSFDAASIMANSRFFTEARRHPYFVQYTRKMRYWKRPLSLAEADPVYADGVARFLNLASSIESRGYDQDRPIGLRRVLYQRSSGFGAQPRRRWFIGDGCHRFACIARIARGEPLPQSYFAVTHALVHRPVDWRAMLFRLGVLDQIDLGGFAALFADSADPSWDALLGWTRRVRERFPTLDLQAMFELRVVA
jgi:hypothetical protein